MSKVQENSAKIQEESSRINQLQRVFNTLHVYAQSKSKTDISKPYTTPSTTATGIAATPTSETKAPTRQRQHPSKTGIARGEYDKIIDLGKKSVFSVTLDSMSLLFGRIVCVDGYTAGTHCDFMDIESGLYTVPVKGRYDFLACCSTNRDKMCLYLCRDRDQKQFRLLQDGQQNGVTLYCEADDLIWLEVKKSHPRVKTF